jgi:hypothetical protein
MNESRCPGCGLPITADPRATYDGYFNCSPECWSIFTEVIGREFSNAVLFGQVHHLTVEAYAVQHAGGSHPDKSVDIHLAGLYLRSSATSRHPPSLHTCKSSPSASTIGRTSNRSRWNRRKRSSM